MLCDNWSACFVNQIGKTELLEVFLQTRSFDQRIHVGRTLRKGWKLRGWKCYREHHNLHFYTWTCEREKHLKFYLYLAFNTVLQAVLFCHPALPGLQTCAWEVMGLNSSSLWAESAEGSSIIERKSGKSTRGLADERLVPYVICLSCLSSSVLLFLYEKHTLRVESLWFLAQLLQWLVRRIQKRGDKVGKWGKRSQGTSCGLNPPLLSSPFFLQSTSPSSPPLTRSHSSGVVTTLWQRPRSPVGWQGIRGGGCRACVSLLNGWRAGSVSGDMCNESDASLDVLAAQGARL